jgi:hypothetical protein
MLHVSYLLAVVTKARYRCQIPGSDPRLARSRYLKENAPMAGIAESVAGAFDHAWDRFLGRLDGLTDEEYLWEPVKGRLEDELAGYSRGHNLRC